MTRVQPLMNGGNPGGQAVSKTVNTSFVDNT